MLRSFIKVCQTFCSTVSMDTTLLKDTLAQISALWDKQSKPKKYIAIISISIPSYLVLREIYWFLFRKYHSLPPGPNGLPIFGAFFLWTGSSHARINLSKKYGPILYSRILGMPAITISSAKLMRKLFTQRQFLNRATIFDPDNDYYHDMNSTGDSHVMPIIQVNGDSWVKRRKLMQDTLFRVLNRTTAGKLLKEAMTTELSPYLNDIIKSNKPWTDPREILEYITLNTMYCTLFDTKLERNSKLHHAILKDIHDALEHSALSVMVIKTPFMKVSIPCIYPLY